MAITLNLQGDCITGIRGTGLSDCVKQEGDPTGFDIMGKSWSISTTDGTLPTKAEYKALIQAGTFYPFNNLANFDQITPDNEFFTGSTGLKQEVRAGKPEYAFTFNKGYCGHKGMYDKKGTNRWNIALKFDTGVFFATDVAESVIKGFDNGMFSVGTYKFLQGTDPANTVVSFQFNSAVELNTRGVFYTWDALGYDMNQINGVINTKVSFQTAPSAGTTVNVYVADDCNRSSDILGLTDANNWVVGGTQATPATVDSVAYNTAGYYVLTLDEALVGTDTISISLGDVSNSYDAAENASGDLYKGGTDLATIS